MELGHLQAQEAFKQACLAFEAKEAHIQSLLSRREAANMVLLIPPAVPQHAPASNGPDPGAWPLCSATTNWPHAATSSPLIWVRVINYQH